MSQKIHKNPFWVPARPARSKVGLYIYIYIYMNPSAQDDRRDTQNDIQPPVNYKMASVTPKVIIR